eukprot:scaffold18096_cov62-Isochrysis_galbana.AAC.1
MGSGEHGTGVGAGGGARGAPDAWGGCLLAGGYCEDSLGRVLQALAISEAEIAQFTVEGCVINIGAVRSKHHPPHPHRPSKYILAM